jgi:iron complex outermembrane receptor protein
VIADMSVRYETEAFTLDLGITNLLDKDYYGVCYDSYGCMQGEGRRISLSLSRSF